MMKIIDVALHGKVDHTRLGVARISENQRWTVLMVKASAKIALRNVDMLRERE